MEIEGHNEGKHRTTVNFRDYNLYCWECMNKADWPKTWQATTSHQPTNGSLFYQL